MGRRIALLQVVFPVFVGWGALPSPARPMAADSLYKEKYRPQFHFTARQWSHRLLNPGQREEGWANDPNGLIHINGEYHFFTQRWHKAWVHAVSRDLVHWEELKPAFWDDDRFGGVQSGTVVADSLNVSGLATGKNPVMIAFYSSTDNRSQCLAYSNDFGRTWSKYGNNPVLVHAERDPNVFWHAPTRKWVMVLYGGPGYHFFTSDNLLAWKKESEIPDYYECPDLFALAVDGDRSRMKWVLMNGDGSYNVGEFTGRSFNPETQRRRLDWGANFYATQSWHDAPENDIRRIQITWMRSDGRKFYPDMPFNQQMTFPAEMTLRNYADTLRLFRKPARQIEILHASTADFSARTLSEGAKVDLDDKAGLLHVVGTVALGPDAEGSLSVRGATVRFSGAGLAIGENEGRFARKLERIKLELLIDRTSIEAFGNDGEISISNCFMASGNSVALSSVKGSIILEDFKVHTLAPAWPASVPQGFSSNLPGPWTPVGGAWKDTATGKVGSGAGDVFSLSARAGTDFTYEGEVGILSGPAGALVFRTNAEASSGYCVNVDMGGYVKLWAPGRGELVRFDTPIYIRQPYHLKVVAKGANIKVFFNHRPKPILDFNDATPVLKGLFGVNLYSGSAVFQDLSAWDDSPTALPGRPGGPGTVAALQSDEAGGEGWTLTGRRAPMPAEKTVKRALIKPKRLK